MNEEDLAYCRKALTEAKIPEHLIQFAPETIEYFRSLRPNKENKHD